MVDQDVRVPTSTPHTTSDPTVLGAAGVPRASAPHNEGRTVAAWSLVAVVLFGAVLVGVGVAVGLAWLTWPGAAVILVGLVVGGILRALGYGQVTAGDRAATR